MGLGLSGRIKSLDLGMKQCDIIHNYSVVGLFIATYNKFIRKKYYMGCFRYNLLVLI